MQTVHTMCQGQVHLAKTAVLNMNIDADILCLQAVRDADEYLHVITNVQQ